jgi:oligopeptide transport system ATP-binding protein
MPSVSAMAEPVTATPLLTVRGLKKYFPIHRGFWQRQVGQVHAVDGVDLDLDRGQALGLVGESGCGKTTAGRCILRLIEPTAGSIRIRGQELVGMPAEPLRRLRRQMQMIFQDPYGSLNPRLTVGQMLTEPMQVHGIAQGSAAWDRARELLLRVGLQADHLQHFPHRFSGGQRQRIGIARALGLEPSLIVCDEPVSALDVSVQAQVINLLRELQEERGLSYVFIAHDLAVVAHLCARVAVMYLGEIVEIGSSAAIYQRPLHPYTQALLSAIPAEHPDRKKQRIVLSGDPPSPLQPSSPERFIRRFPQHAAAFEGGEIRLHAVGNDHQVRCARPEVLEQLAAAPV